MSKLNINLLKDIQSLEELKNISTVQEISSIINSLIPNMMLVNNTYEDLWKTIECLKNNFSTFRNSYFISEQAKYIYILTRLEGKSKTKELNISDSMYRNKNMAKEWRNNIVKYVHPDKGGSDEAFQELEKLYRTMINIDEE
ncbi:hypothetical protein KNO35_02565 [Pasteurella multocida]|uniref:hypothetical protein n=1 Tax=Pasteurella multocida TaxID=747 RepID=UPI00077688E7|nr:hypothetical protein [Pasteurella multocida]AMM81533.1 hypothetical protein AW43_03670 [Pasteurella multocida subsp. multocida PMTB2.1]MCT8983677.1 hypothetical protein [Pasteurella multocida]MDT8779458.1 hypothetical protein [Pasteurella multocida]